MCICVTDRISVFHVVQIAALLFYFIFFAGGEGGGAGNAVYNKH